MTTVSFSQLCVSEILLDPLAGAYVDDPIVETVQHAIGGPFLHDEVFRHECAPRVVNPFTLIGVRGFSSEMDEWPPVC
ncbi:hypothetical protein [Pseudomonas sp. NPDC096950]|uniref:hypothetical protein n=1 Tax=Pseudomonas sp. NPDC096950 TaxID=3364485 RepID=UPI00383B01A1